MKPAAVLLDVNLQALKIIRSLGRRDIPVVGVVTKTGSWEQSSRYCEVRLFEHAGDSEKLTDFLIQLSNELGGHPILIPMQDENVLFLSRHRNELSSHYSFLLPEPEIVEKLVSKAGLRELAEQAGIEKPLTYSPTNMEHLQNLLAGMRYPVLIKPIFSRSWSHTPEIQSVVRGSKVVRVTNNDDLLTTYTLLAQLDNRLVIEEEIIGSDSNLVYYVGYFDNSSNPLASFVGMKERVTPIHYGSASYVVSKYVEEVIRISVEFMQKVGYKGHVGIEYKYDERDKSYKLIEVNVRFGLWDGLATVCGIDFPYLNYQYLQNDSAEIKSRFDQGVKWVSFERDLWAFRDYHREKQITTWGWIKSISTGRRDFAVFAADDPLPFLISSVRLAKQLIRRVATRLPSLAMRHR